MIKESDEDEQGIHTSYRSLRFGRDGIDWRFRGQTLHHLLCPAARSGTLIHGLFVFPRIFDGSADQKTREMYTAHGHSHTCTHPKLQRFLFPRLAAMLRPAAEGMDAVAGCERHGMQ